jgi:hypothetical protein
VAAVFDNIRTTRAGESSGRIGGPPLPVLRAAPKRINLDSEDNIKLLRRLEEWWREARDLEAMNRRERYIDHDFYDSDQWDTEKRATLMERGQAPLVFNLIRPVVDWITGTERRTRIDWRILPRGEEDTKLAEIKTDLMKFVSDVTNSGWHRSQAFKDAVISGLGWLEEYARTDGEDLPIGYRHQDWKEIHMDPYSRANDLTDCRYLVRHRWVDFEYAIAMYPERADELRRAAAGYTEPEWEFGDEDGWDIPSVLWGSNRGNDESASIIRYSSSGLWRRGSRYRVRLCEIWFRRPVASKKIMALTEEYTELNHTAYVEGDPVLAALVKTDKIGLIDAVADQMWMAVFHPGFLCSLKKSPYKHKRFPFTPVWAFRRHRDGQPYGYVRGLRDPQEEYNVRRSKALLAASANKVWVENGAVDEDDQDVFEDQVNRPNGIIPVATGALKDKRIMWENNLDVSLAHVQLMNEAKIHINEGSGVTRDNQGLNSNAISGRAILAKQQQGAVGTAEVFDLYRLSIKLSGQKTLSNTEQYLTLPMTIRIEGAEKGQLVFLSINKPQIDPDTGQITFVNDVTESEADFVVDQQDYRETMRMAMAEMLLETIRTLPPEVQIQLLDLAIDLTDLPKKDELIARIRRLNGAAAENDPQAAAQQQAAQQAQQAEAQKTKDLHDAKLAADADLAKARAAEFLAKEHEHTLDAKQLAFNLAGTIHNAIPLAPTADMLFARPQPPQTYNSPPALAQQPPEEGP